MFLACFSFLNLWSTAIKSNEVGEVSVYVTQN